MFAKSEGKHDQEAAGRRQHSDVDARAIGDLSHQRRDRGTAHDGHHEDCRADFPFGAAIVAGVAVRLPFDFTLQMRGGEAVRANAPLLRALGTDESLT